MEILHIARTDLQNIGVWISFFNEGCIQYFSNYRKAILVRCTADHFQAIQAKPLEPIRRRPGFISAAPDKFYAKLTDKFGNAENLIFRLYRTGPGNDVYYIAANHIVIYTKRSGFFFEDFTPKRVFFIFSYDLIHASHPGY